MLKLNPVQLDLEASRLLWCYATTPTPLLALNFTLPLFDRPRLVRSLKPVAGDLGLGPERRIF